MTSSGGRSMVSVANAIAAAVFRPSGSTRTAAVGHLLADEPLVAPIGDDRHVVGQPVQALDGPLQERPLVEQRQEGLGALGSAERMEPGATPTGQDHGVHAPLSLRAAPPGQAATTGSGRPASEARMAALSVRSQGRSRSGRPKWPYAAVWR